MSELTNVEHLLRVLTPRVLGALIRRYGHFDACEDATQEALLAAAVQLAQGRYTGESAELADHRGIAPAD